MFDRKQLLRFQLVILFVCVGGAPWAWADDNQQICRHNRQAFGIDLEGDGPRYAPERRADITHLRLDVTPNFRNRTVSGSTRIEFQPIAQPLEELKLDAVRLTIHDVRSDHEIQDYTNDGKHLRIRFAEPIPASEEAFVEIDHYAEPVMGLYFRTPEMGYPESDIQVWTQGESHEASFWFPCFDYPNERSSTEVICHVPEDMIVLSNGRKVGESIDDNGLKRVHWLQEKPHVAYLICLVAGKFEKLEKQSRGIPLGFYVQPSLAEHAANSFRDTDKIMAYFEQEIGVPFPWEKYDQVTILDFVAGGMENTTLTTLTHNTIFTTATENLRQSRRLDAHELAHQWFGDYVTCKDWSNLWLNEGFATYYTHLYEGHKYGRDAMLYGLYKDAKNSVLPRSDDSRPIVYRDYKNPAEQFDYRAYPKGSWVLHMVRSQLGPDLYRRGIRHYLELHALESVVSDDLRQALEDVSGRPLDRFFDQWVYHPGAPDLEIKYQWDLNQKLAKISVRQKQVKPNASWRQLFHLPTQVRFVVEGDPIDHRITIDQEEQEFHFPLPHQPAVVRFDPEYTVLAKVNSEKPDAMLFAQLGLEDDMMGRLLAATALGDRKTRKSVKQLKTALQNDPFYGVRIAASEALAQIGTDQAYQALKDSRSQSDARVRRQVVRDIASFYRPATAECLLEVIKGEANPDIQALAIRALGSFDTPAARRIVQEKLRSSSFRNQLADAAVDAIKQQRNSEHRRALMQVVRDHADRFTTHGLADALVAVAIVNQQQDDKSAARLLIESFLQDPRVDIQRGAIRALGELGDLRSATVLRQFQRVARHERLTKAAEDALQKLNETAPVAPKEVSQLRKQVIRIEKENETFKSKLETLESKFESIRAAEQQRSEQSESEPSSESDESAND